MCIGIKWNIKIKSKIILIPYRPPACFNDEVMLGYLLQPQGFHHGSLVSQLQSSRFWKLEKKINKKCPAIIAAKWTRIVTLWANTTQIWTLGIKNDTKSGLLSTIWGWTRIWTLCCRGEYSVRVPAGPCRLSFFKICPFSAEFYITYMYSIYIYLAKIILLRVNLLFMAEFFNSHQKLCQGTND